MSYMCTVTRKGNLVVRQVQVLAIIVCVCVCACPKFGVGCRRDLITCLGYGSTRRNWADLMCTLQCRLYKKIRHRI